MCFREFFARVPRRFLELKIRRGCGSESSYFIPPSTVFSLIQMFLPLGAGRSYPKLLHVAMAIFHYIFDGHGTHTCISLYTDFKRPDVLPYAKGHFNCIHTISRPNPGGSYREQVRFPFAAP